MQRSIFLPVLLFLLSTQSFAQECQTIISRPGTVLLQCGRLKVLRLEGTPEDRQRNHGALLGKELSRAPLEYFAKKALDPVRSMPRPVKWITEKIMNFGVRLLHHSTPPYLAREIDAFAQGAGMNAIDVRRAMSVPDIAAFLVKWSANSMLDWIPTAGCTSVAKRFSTGGFVYGRNLDFAGALTWDAHPLLTIHIPPQKLFRNKAYRLRRRWGWILRNHGAQRSRNHFCCSPELFQGRKSGWRAYVYDWRCGST